MPRFLRPCVAALLCGCAGMATASAMAAPPGSGLLFHASGDRDLVADQADGDPVPNFQSHVDIVPDGAIGGAMRWHDDGYVAWKAPGNIYAQRGTLSFFWRPREPVGEAPFVIFRVGFADHSSWDMAFLRIDWNGHGFDAFVTDANLARSRVSFRMDGLPAPDAWRHIAFAWDEATGVRLFVDGREVARKDGRANLDSGLDQFGLAGRVLSPHQVQSRYNFMRGSDVDEIRIYDHMLEDAQVAALAEKRDPAVPAADVADRQGWLHRYGWDRASPPVLSDPVTRIRKVEFSDARDLKEWMWKGVDGIAETTWPGVYNRSRLPGRDDYFELPDWNVYVEGGKDYVLSIPANERVNRVEIRGAAYGALSASADGRDWRTVARRQQGEARSFDAITPQTGGQLRFSNIAQETPIQEIWAYDVGAGTEPAGTLKLSYVVHADASPDFAALKDLNAFIAGRYPPRERDTVVALPQGAGNAAPGAGSATASASAVRPADARPIVHVLIPASFGDAFPDRPLARAWNYGWENMHDGLDGIAIDLPPMTVTPGKDGLIPLNIRVKDPIWPMRDMIDLSVSVRPGQARTLWLDLRDRILTKDSLYLAIASAAPDFGPAAIDGMAVRLVFKDREAAKAEHIADRFNQVKDNWGFLVEEHTASKREGLYARLYGDVTDLLRVDPDNVEGRRYWADINYNWALAPKVAVPATPAGVPTWAFRQVEDLKLVGQFVDWWIDNRQVPYGDMGGGISDDTDLAGQWPGLALMGYKPDKINASLRALSEASYRNGMHVNGLAYITTDELHAYEEGMNSDAGRLYLNWGEPIAVERLMATTRALTGVILRNPAGHLHFASSWYGGRKIYREPAWEWQKPYAFVVVHAPVLMGVYNANPVARNLVTGLIDGWLAHGKEDAKGNWSFPNEINWRTDAERVGDGGGATTPMQPSWAAYRFTGDEKYLRPILGRVAKSGPQSLADITEDAVALLGRTRGWADRLTAQARAGDASDFARYHAWAATGDRAWLDALHGDAIADKIGHMYMYTQGHWWSDRVEQPSDILQRERMGGIALKRGWQYPGNTVSWRFAEDGGAMQVAILMPNSTPDHFKVIAYNLSDHVQRADMTAWDVTAGRWRMTAGTSAANGDVADGAPEAQDITLERSASLPVSFAPHTTSIFEFTLVAPGDPVETRPDLGIGSDDLAIRKGRLRLTIHSLGAKPTSGGTASVRDDAGRIMATAAIPPMEAPLDLAPRSVSVTLALPKGASTVTVALPGDAPEVTRMNNRLRLP